MAIYKPNKLELALAKSSFNGKARLDFYEEIAALVDAGVNLPDAIQMTWDAASEEGKRPKEMLAIVMQDIILRKRNGASLGEALKPWVSDEEVMVLEAIENSNDFSTGLRNYITLMTKKRQIREKIFFGSLPPIAIFALIFVIIAAFSKTLVPIISQTLPMEQWTGASLGLKYMANFTDHYLKPTLFGILSIATLIAILLPRWKGRGRTTADNFPIFSTYRVYTGISFLVAVASLIQGGMSAPEAVNKLRMNGSPYIKSRIRKIHNQILNGTNFGAAMYRSQTGWPDKKMNLRIKLFAETQDLSSQLTKLSIKWLDESYVSVSAKIALAKNIAFLLAAASLITIMLGIFSLQSAMQATV